MLAVTCVELIFRWFLLFFSCSSLHPKWNRCHFFIFFFSLQLIHLHISNIWESLNEKWCHSSWHRGRFSCVSPVQFETILLAFKKQKSLLFAAKLCMLVPTHVNGRCIYLFLLRTVGSFAVCKHSFFLFSANSLHLFPHNISSQNGFFYNIFCCSHFILILRGKKIIFWPNHHCDDEQLD